MWSDLLWIVDSYKGILEKQWNAGVRQEKPMALRKQLEIAVDEAESGEEELGVGRKRVGSQQVGRVKAPAQKIP